jgi:hypothetical protein
MIRWTATAVLVAGLVAAAPAGAHTTSTGLVVLTVTGATLTYRLTLVLGELPEEPRRLLVAATTGDAAAAERVAAEVRRRATFRADGGTCRPGRVRLQASRLADSRVDLELELRCPGEPARLAIRDDWADVLGSHHRTLARIDAAGAVHQIALLPDAREATVELAPHAATGAPGFLWLGAEHILTGYDHLLFLAALLLGGGGLLALLKIVTAFTVAHSLTLGLAVLGVVAPPARLVETVIAASIVWVAVENLVAREAASRRWLVSFAFGLVHGFGFAAALGPLGLPGRQVALALLGFNVGVEAGQLAVVLSLVPLLAAVRRLGWERPVVRVASLALAAIGTAWFVQRLFVA